MRDIRELSYEDLAAYVRSIGEAGFRATQIFEWIYQKQAADFGTMSNLSSKLRARLEKDFFLNDPKILKRQVSSDGTVKVLFELSDKEPVETVMIPTETRATLCVSTQAGCKFGCRFCASGIGGWKRNLTAAEILAQVLCMGRIVGERRLSHIVFMGVGEPLDNYDNLLKAIRTINANKGMNIAARRITVSTCGLVPKIKKLAREGMQIELAVSLHGFDTASRDALMPVNRKYPLEDLMAACREYNKATKRQITFEYILIKDVTCTDEAAKALGRLLKGLLCKLNLIPCNPVEEFGHVPPSRNQVFAFKDALARAGVHATVRAPRGQDVAAACGQLRHADS